MFSGGYRMRPVAWNGLMQVFIFVKPDWFGEMRLLYEKKLEKKNDIKVFMVFLQKSFAICHLILRIGTFASSILKENTVSKHALWMISSSL